MTVLTQAPVGSVHARLQAAEEAVAALAAVAVEDLDGAGAGALYARVHALADRVRAVGIRVLPVIEAHGWWALDGHRTAAQWVVHRTGVSVATARRDLHLGRTLHEELPATAAAVRAGDLALEQARVIATVAATSPARRAALVDPDSPCAEPFLVHHARLLPVDPLRSLVRRWAAAADPDTDERGYRDATEREFLDVSRTLGGFHLAGFLTEEHGTVLATALAAVSGPPAPGDDRPSSARRAQSLCDLARTVLDHGLTRTAAAVRPHLNIHLHAQHLAPTWTTALHQAALDLHRGDTPDATGTADTTETAGTTDATGTAHPPRTASGPSGPPPGPLTGPATLDDGTPVPLSVLRRLACDSEVTRILLGPGSTILDVGRAARTVTGQLRRAVITRDRHCAYPGCHTPPQRCEVHHPHHWADGGPTSLTNSVLLCWHHHDLVHRTGTTVTAGTTFTADPAGTVGTVGTAGTAGTAGTVGTGTPGATLSAATSHPARQGQPGRPETAPRTISSAATLHPRWVFHDRHGRTLIHDGPGPRPPP